MTETPLDGGSPDSSELSAERNPDTLPTMSDPSGQCPNCGRVSNFDVVHNDILSRYNRVISRVSILDCQGCRRKCVAVEQKHLTPVSFAKVAVSAPEPRHWDFVGVFWWPIPDLMAHEDAAVPDDIAEAYAEGTRCLAVQAPHAAVAMFRNTVAQIVQDKGSDEAKNKRTLNEKIKQMVADRTLWADFGDWAHHVRHIGNAGAHQEEWAPVSIEEATDLQKFVWQLIEFLYVQPARRSAARKPTKRPTT